MSKLFDDALKAEGVGGQLAALARSIYAQESTSGKNAKTSNAGARGGMQILPTTFASVADATWSIDDPLQNARAGIRYLKELHEKAGGDPKLTAVGYYGGPGGMEKAKRGVAVSDPRNPKAPNTLQYADQVVARMGDPSFRPEMGSDPITAARIDATPKGVTRVPVDETGAVPLPAEFLAAVGTRPKAPITVEQENAWLNFLKAMPGNRQPVKVADLDFSNPKVVTPPAYLAPAQVTSLVPNFAAFEGFGKRI